MSEPFVYVTSNRAKVRSCKAVLAVLSEFDFDGLYFCVQANKKGARKGTLRVRGEGWPLAVAKALLEAKGEVTNQLTMLLSRGFEELLRRLAPHLETPLLVQAVDCVPGETGIYAREWAVLPDADEVLVHSLQLSHAIDKDREAGD